MLDVRRRFNEILCSTENVYPSNPTFASLQSIMKICEQIKMVKLEVGRWRNLNDENAFILGRLQVTTYMVKHHFK